MLKYKSLLNLTLLLSLLLLIALVLLGSPAGAQQLSGKSKATLPAAVQSYIADMGEHNPLVQSLLKRPSGTAPGKVSSSANSPAICGTWSIAPSENASDFNQLADVAGTGDNLWAVGQACYSGCDTPDEVDHTLIERWDGTAWSIVPSPNVGDGLNYLNSVSVISKRDAWAVGESFNTVENRWATLALHWDGTAWTVVPSPNPGPANNYFATVLAASTNNVLVLGSYRVRPGYFIDWAERWNGTGWTDTQAVNPGAAYNVFYGGTKITPNDVWAVGAYCNLPDCSDGSKNLTEHYDGHTWTSVPNPLISDNLQLWRVSGSSKRDVWAVGLSCSSPDCENYAEHWDGSTWSLVPVPNNATGGAFWNVLDISRDNAYIFGSQTADFNSWQNLVLHWDGAAWSEVIVPSAGVYDNDLRASVALAHNEVLVAGDQDDGDGELTQALHYWGDCK